MSANANALPRRVTCPSCLQHDMEPFHEVRGVPTNSCILLETRAEALAYPIGDITLAFCEGCGFICNTSFDPKLTEYSGRYEETQAFSATFNAFHERLAQSLVDRHSLRGKELVEIGCGKGEFLKLLCDLGDNRGLGFDPGYSEARGESAGADRFKVVRDLFSDKYTDRQADFVACKMTLEHISTPHAFTSAAAKLVRHPGGVIFIQVPEASRIVRECAFEDIYYEHCSYFTGGSLSRLFRRLGFAVLRVDVDYDGQYLTVEASPTAAREQTASSGDRGDLDDLSAAVKAFPERMARKREEWTERLTAWKGSGKRVVLWGSGSKGVSFLTTIRGADLVEEVVDINPYRHGYFMPRTGQEIVAPERLRELGPDVIVVMNRIYLPEIRRQVAGLGLGSTPEFLAL
jgi:SAM-dependent methyltransferase